MSDVCKSAIFRRNRLLSDLSNNKCELRFCKINFGIKLKPQTLP